MLAGDKELPQSVFVQGKRVSAYPRMTLEAAKGKVLRIPVFGEDILRRKCAPVKDFATDDLAQLISDMFLTMYVAEGVGLAANQVDVDMRLFVYDCPDSYGNRHVGHIINPVIQKPAAGPPSKVDDEEGCLSVPGPRRSVVRDAATTVHGFDFAGRPLVIDGRDYFARCLQHETDHLNGRVYLDLLTRRQRDSALDEMAELHDEIMAERRDRAEKLLNRPALPAAFRRSQPTSS